MLRHLDHNIDMSLSVSLMSSQRYINTSQTDTRLTMVACLYLCHLYTNISHKHLHTQNTHMAPTLSSLSLSPNRRRLNRRTTVSHELFSDINIQTLFNIHLSHLMNNSLFQINKASSLIKSIYIYYVRTLFGI